MQNYKELKVWKKSHELTLEIYKISQTFPNAETYGLVSQIRRSSFSIPSNIAEGRGKISSKDLVNFLQIALGSSNETEYFLILSKDLKYIPIEKFEDLEKKINEIKAMLISLIKKVRAKVLTT